MGCFRPSKSTRMVDGPFLRKMTPFPFLSLGQRSFPRTERRTLMPCRISISSVFIGQPRWIQLELSRSRKKFFRQPNVIVSSRTKADGPGFYAGVFRFGSTRVTAHRKRPPTEAALLVSSWINGVYFEAVCVSHDNRLPGLFGELLGGLAFSTRSISSTTIVRWCVRGGGRCII
jgi:hypothetical protein